MFSIEYNSNRKIATFSISWKTFEDVKIKITKLKQLNSLILLAMELLCI